MHSVIYSFCEQINAVLRKFLSHLYCIEDIKVAQLNVLLELQLRTSLVISQILPV